MFTIWWVGAVASTLVGFVLAGVCWDDFAGDEPAVLAMPFAGALWFVIGPALACWALGMGLRKLHKNALRARNNDPFIAAGHEEVERMLR